MMGKTTKAEIMKDEGTKVTLADGKKYDIKFDLNSMCTLQEKFGDDVITVLTGIDGSDFKIIRTVLFALFEHEGLTEKEVGSLITMANMSSVVEALGQALGDAMPELESTQTESGK